MKHRSLAILVPVGLLVGSFVLALASPPAVSDERKAAVEARQNAMKEVGKHMKALGGYVKGGVGTAQEAEANAQALADLSKKIPGLFQIQATLDEMDAVGKNRAKPDIWSDWQGFEAAATNMGDEATAMVAALKSGDKAAEETQFGMLGKEGCGGCHEKFRGPKVE